MDKYDFYVLAGIAGFILLSETLKEMKAVNPFNAAEEVARKAANDARAAQEWANFRIGQGLDFGSNAFSNLVIENRAINQMRVDSWENLQAKLRATSDALTHFGRTAIGQNLDGSFIWAD